MARAHTFSHIYSQTHINRGRSQMVHSKTKFRKKWKQAEKVMGRRLHKKY